MPEAIAISASATASPPSETSWTAVTRPSQDQRAHEVADALLVLQVDGRGRAVLAAEDLAEIERLAEMRAPAGRRADEQDRLALGLEGERGALAASRRSARRRRSPASAGSPRRSSRCRATRCRRRSGSRARGRPRRCPAMARTNWPMISGRSGLPKLRLSVTASGVAPTAVRLRQHSATACLPPSNGIGLDVARRHVERERQRLVACRRCAPRRRRRPAAARCCPGRGGRIAPRPSGARRGRASRSASAAPRRDRRRAAGSRGRAAPAPSARPRAGRIPAPGRRAP